MIVWYMSLLCINQHCRFRLTPGYYTRNKRPAAKPVASLVSRHTGRIRSRDFFVHPLFLFFYPARLLQQGSSSPPEKIVSCLRIVCASDSKGIMGTEMSSKWL
ncbi:hypothetical protein AVEN_179695-1 [Araneus ventricosus]|uniref:Uncharacterized protein n=1 Tax=Araneus ventricosus TaxID=182803 RepID=A0A4Y2SCL1_ARAVE|nr:hypothetical protein AVEN_179695-1 [Araneus ventricosus]